jgi:hypothetical protein
MKLWCVFLCFVDGSRTDIVVLHGTMAFVATAYVWGASAFSVPPIRYEATVAAYAAADAANKEEGRLSLSVGGDPPLGSPTARSTAENGASLVHGDELTGGYSSFRNASARSPRSGAMNSTRRFRSNNKRHRSVQPVERVYE